MKIIVKRTLNDYEAWRKMVEDNEGLRRKHGSRGADVYRSAKNPNEVTLVFDWDDAKPYAAYFSTPEVQAALAASGVGPTDITEVSESFHLAS